MKFPTKEQLSKSNKQKTKCHNMAMTLADAHDLYKKLNPESEIGE